MMDTQADFELLGRTMTTVQSIYEKSAGVTKLVQACQSFYQIACAYYNQQTPRTMLPQQRSQAPFSLPESDAVSDPMLADNVNFDMSPSTFNNMTFPMQEDWDQMLDGWELGLGAEPARQMSSYLGHNPSMGGFGGSFG